MQGAGGVGGLLAIKPTGTNTLFVAYDGNGNVTDLIDAATGTTSGQFEYGPFGEVIRASGPMANTNPFRFSTKYTDDESDFLYYGFRYYNTSTGRWLTRDPIEECGGINLYACVINNPISYADTDGRQLFPPVLLQSPPVSVRPILEPIARPGPGIPPEWLPQQAPTQAPSGGTTMSPLNPPVPVVPTPNTNPNLATQSAPNSNQS